MRVPSVVGHHFIAGFDRVHDAGCDGLLSCRKVGSAVAFVFFVKKFVYFIVKKPRQIHEAEKFFFFVD